MDLFRNGTDTTGTGQVPFTNFVGAVRLFIRAVPIFRSPLNGPHESGMRHRTILVIHLACGEAPPEMGEFSTGTATSVAGTATYSNRCRSMKLAISELRRELWRVSNLI